MTRIFKGKLGLLIRLVLSVGLIGGLACHIGSPDILAQVSRVHWQVVALAVLVLASSVLIITPRWTVILGALGYRIRWMALVSSVFLGFLFNQLLPTAVGGDVLRAWQVRTLGVPLDVAIHSVLLDRISGLIVVFIGVVLLVPFAGPLLAHSSLSSVGAMLVIFVAGAVGVACLWAFSRMPPFVSPFAAGFQRAIAAFVASGMLIVRRPRALGAVFVLSLIGIIAAAIALGLLASELHADVSPMAIAVVTFGAMLASAVPISIAGWGVREGALVLLFGAYGVPAQTAFTVSILFGACLVLASAPGALGLLDQSAKSRVRQGEVE